MNDLIETARVEGTIHYHGVDLYDPAVSAVEVRRRIGMVFQKPNPFPKTVYDNVAYGPRLLGFKKKSSWTTSSSARSRRGAVGRGARTASRRPPSACPAASSSGSASPGPSPSSPR